MKVTWEMFFAGCWRARIDTGEVLEIKKRFVSHWELRLFANEDTPFGDKLADFSTLAAGKRKALDLYQLQTKLLASDFSPSARKPADPSDC